VWSSRKGLLNKETSFRKIILLLKFIYLHVINFKITYIGIYTQLNASLPDL